VQALIGWTPTLVLDDIVGDVVDHLRGGVVAPSAVGIRTPDLGSVGA
jgi:hypothetical protein